MVTLALPGETKKLVEKGTSRERSERVTEKSE
jgi:hypothetical protein